MIFPPPRLAFLTHGDIRELECFREDTLLAVKAPYGSTLKVPDPDEGMPPGCRRYEIQLKSRSDEPIEVFLIQEYLVASSTNQHPPSAAHHPNNNTSVLDPATDVTDTVSLLNGTVPEDTILKHFHLPSDSYNFELKPGEGIGDLYGFADMFGPEFGESATTTSSSNNNNSNNHGEVRALLGNVNSLTK